MMFAIKFDVEHNLSNLESLQFTTQCLLTNPRFQFEVHKGKSLHPFPDEVIDLDVAFSDAVLEVFDTGETWYPADKQPHVALTAMNSRICPIPLFAAAFVWFLLLIALLLPLLCLFAVGMLLLLMLFMFFIEF